MKKKQLNTKIKWLSLLVLAISLFLIALSTGLVYLNIVVIVMSVFIYKYGNPVLFAEYEESQKLKREQALIIQQATKKIIVSKKIFNKNGDDSTCRTDE